jgi:hypothetical protein
MDAESVDAVVTDPPYNIGTPQLITDMRSADKRLVGKDFGSFDRNAIEPREWFPHVDRVVKPSGLVFAFYGARALDVLLDAARASAWEPIQDFHWLKTNPTVPMRKVGFSWATETGFFFRRKGERHRFNVNAGIHPNWILAPIVGGNERRAGTAGGGLHLRRQRGGARPGMARVARLDCARRRRRYARAAPRQLARARLRAQRARHRVALRRAEIRRLPRLPGLAGSALPALRRGRARAAP